MTRILSSAAFVAAFTQLLGTRDDAVGRRGDTA